MAKVITLKPGETAPEGGDRILISRSLSGNFDTVRWSSTQIAYHHGNWPLEQALKLAQRDAETFSIPTIYVQEDANAHRP